MAGPRRYQSIFGDKKSAICRDQSNVNACNDHLIVFI